MDYRGMKFKTTAQKFVNGEWIIVSGEVHRVFKMPPSNKQVSNTINRILRDMRGMMPDFKEWSVEVIE